MFAKENPNVNFNVLLRKHRDGCSSPYLFLTVYKVRVCLMMQQTNPQKSMLGNSTTQ